MTSSNVYAFPTATPFKYNVDLPFVICWQLLLTYYFSLKVASIECTQNGITLSFLLDYSFFFLPSSIHFFPFVHIHSPRMSSTVIACLACTFISIPYPTNLHPVITSLLLSIVFHAVIGGVSEVRLVKLLRNVVERIWTLLSACSLFDYDLSSVILQLKNTHLTLLLLSFILQLMYLSLFFFCFYFVILLCYIVTSTPPPPRAQLPSFQSTPDDLLPGCAGMHPEHFPLGNHKVSSYCNKTTKFLPVNGWPCCKMKQRKCHRDCSTLDLKETGPLKTCVVRKGRSLFKG